MWRMLVPVGAALGLGAVGFYFAGKVFGPIPVWVMIATAVIGLLVVAALPTIIVKLQKK